MRFICMILLFFDSLLPQRGSFAKVAYDSVDNPEVIMTTEYGDIIFELFLDRAPVTAGNFLEYVKNNIYKDACFYRVVKMDNQPDNKIKIEVIQGGLDHCSPAQSLPPVKHESTNLTGIKHLNGTLSMARNEPGTAGSEFFICINDQPELDYGGRRNPDGQGFAAFGRVIKGIEVVRKIQNLPSTNQMLNQFVKILNVKIIP